MARAQDVVASARKLYAPEWVRRVSRTDAESESMSARGQTIFQWRAALTRTIRSWNAAASIKNDVVNRKRLANFFQNTYTTDYRRTSPAFACLIVASAS